MKESFMKHFYNFLIEQEDTAERIKKALKNGSKKTLHGIGYVMQVSGKKLKDHADDIADEVRRTTGKTLHVTGKGIEYIGKKAREV